MTIYVKATEQILSDAQIHSVGRQKILDFAAEIESSQYPRFERWHPKPCCLVRKLYGRKNRLLAIEKEVGEHTVYVLLRLLIKGTGEYDKYYDAGEDGQVAFALKAYDKELNDDELREWVEERSRVSPPPAPEELSTAEKSFLWHHDITDEEGVFICETHEFLEDLGQKEMKDNRVRVPNLALRALEIPIGQVREVRSSESSELRLLAFRANEFQCVFLRLFYGENDQFISTEINRWQDDLDGKTEQEVLRYCKVSYPEILCADERFWVKSHSSKAEQEANLSLSPEESLILQTCETTEGNNVGFPLFVNGRAGSGKSTILQYMFAFRFLRWAKCMRAENPDSYPLYLATSKGLLEVARAAVETILKLNYRQLDEPDDQQLIASVENCFQATPEYLHSLLPDGDKEKFPWENRIDYAEFRRIWNVRYGKERKAIKLFGPQVSWHVIRGLIKGLTEETYDRDDYFEIPRDERTVSQETFELVHDRVWSSWYSTLPKSELAWDDQDLARHLLQNKLLPQQHVALFCDEAQDFTRLELEAIYQCSIFSDRTIGRQDASKIPFVFVGDPFQTLNPTGFRWESVQAAFTERIVLALHRFDRKAAKPKLHYEELLLNYRSAKLIVDFCNTIQMARAVLFDHKSLRPQTTWRIEAEPNPPVFLDVGQDWLKELFVDEANADLTFVVPCEEGEEIRYVEDDPYLREVVARDEDKVPRNVKSPAQAKGLEFNRVVLYGWSKCPEASKISDLLKSNQTPSLTIDEKLPLEYFMNNLYVAASRAKRRLFVLDDEGSLNKLWEFAHDEDRLNRVAKLPGGEHWQEEVGLMLSGNAQSLEDNRASHYEMAVEYEKNGLITRDFGTLKQAAQYYDLANLSNKANECRAQAFLLYERFEDAGVCFEKSGKLEEAVDAWWRGSCYREISDFAERQSAYVSRPRCQLASYLADTKATRLQFLDLLTNLRKTADISPDARRDLKTTKWGNALEAAIAKSLDDHSDSNGLKNALETLDELVALGANVSDISLARLCYHTSDFERAVQLYGNESNRPEVVHARAMIAIKKEEAGKELSKMEVRSLAKYHFSEKKFTEAARHFASVGDADRGVECVVNTLGDSDSSTEQQIGVVSNAIRAFVVAGRWPDLVTFVSDGDAKAISRSNQKSKVCKSIRVLITENGLLPEVLVPALAKSELIPEGKADEKKAIHSLLADITRRRGWHQTVSRKVMGAAVERSGLDIDALAYYEKWRDSNPPSYEKEYAEKRWLTCKLRQAKREEEISPRSVRARSYHESVERLLDKRGWDSGDIPSGYPPLDAEINRTVKAQMKATVTPNPHVPSNMATLGGLSLRFSSLRGWVNIESEDELCARVLVAEKRVANSDVDFEEVDYGYFCAEWKLRLIWQDDRLTLTKGDKSLTLVEGTLADSSQLP